MNVKQVYTILLFWLFKQHFWHLYMNEIFYFNSLSSFLFYTLFWLLVLISLLSYFNFNMYSFHLLCWLGPYAMIFFFLSFAHSLSSNAVGVVTLLILTASHSNFIFFLLFGKNTKNKDADKKISESVQQLIPRFIQTLLISLSLLSPFLPIHNISSSFAVTFGLLG